MPVAKQKAPGTTPPKPRSPKTARKYGVESSGKSQSSFVVFLAEELSGSDCSDPDFSVSAWARGVREGTPSIYPAVSSSTSAATQPLPAQFTFKVSVSGSKMASTKPLSPSGLVGNGASTTKASKAETIGPNTLARFGSLSLGAPLDQREAKPVKNNMFMPARPKAPMPARKVDHKLGGGFQAKPLVQQIEEVSKASRS